MNRTFQNLHNFRKDYPSEIWTEEDLIVIEVNSLEVLNAICEDFDIMSVDINSNQINVWPDNLGNVLVMYKPEE